MARDISNKTLIMLLVFTISISVVWTVITLSMIKDYREKTELTGSVTQGTVELSVLELVSINVVTSEINFGSGPITTATDLSSQQVNPGTFNPCIEVGGVYSSSNECRGIQIENIGNVNINLTMNSSQDGNSLFLGDNTTDEFRFAVAEGNITSNQSDSCKINVRSGLSLFPQNTNYSSGYMNWTNITKSFIYTLCHNLSFADNARSVVFEVNLTVPSDEGNYNPGTQRIAQLSFIAESVD